LAIRKRLLFLTYIQLKIEKGLLFYRVQMQVCFNIKQDNRDLEVPVILPYKGLFGNSLPYWTAAYFFRSTLVAPKPYFS
jgi:hypothetical protein